MAARKEYAYQLRGNQLSLVEKDFTGIDDGLNYTYTSGAGIDIPSGATTYKSPLVDISDGLEIEYAYSPTYQAPIETEPGENLASIDGWTVVDGYLTLLLTQKNFSASPFTTNFIVNNYLLVENMSPWDGIHKIQEVGGNPYTNDSKHAGLKTYTKVNISVPYWSGTPTVSTTETIILEHGMFTVSDFIWITGSDAAVNNNGLFSISNVVEVGYSGITDKLTISTRFSRGNTGASPYTTDFEEVDAYFAADSSGTIHIRKAYKANSTSSMTAVIDVLSDESDVIDLPTYLNKALVYYVKAKMQEDIGNMDLREYFMKEFRKMVEKHENSKVTGPRRIMPGNFAIR